MSFNQLLQNLSGNTPISRRCALTGLSSLALAACSRPASTADSGIAYYTCTMHPFVRSQDPKGRCPVCGMNLVAVLKSSASAGQAQMAYIAPSRLDELGAKSEAVTVQPKTNALLIPASAVLPTGGTTLVFVDHGDGQVEPREIQLGVEKNAAVDVISGLKKDERVFVTGLFLIDSECRIQGVLKTWGDRP